MIAVTRGKDDTRRPRRRVPGTEIAGAVEVLNGTDILGLARATTRRLRLAGIDVVYFGTLTPKIDTTKILVRRGDSVLAATVRGVLGVGVIESQPNANLLLDVSVLLGNDFTPVELQP